VTPLLAGPATLSRRLAENAMDSKLYKEADGRPATLDAVTAVKQLGWAPAGAHDDVCFGELRACRHSRWRRRVRAEIGPMRRCNRNASGPAQL